MRLVRKKTCSLKDRQKYVPRPTENMLAQRTTEYAMPSPVENMFAERTT